MLIRVLRISQSKTITLDLTGRKLIKAAALAAVIIATTGAEPAMAATADIQDRVNRASEPIKDLLIGVADPVCYLVFTWGLLECMLGKASSGVTRMKYATLGYMGMNWLPVLMDIIRQAKP